jgi:hypothetical protein
VTELELPTGEVVTPDDVFSYGGYPYRFVPADEHEPTARPAGPGPTPEEVDFYLVPLFWGGGDMDVPFRDRAALEEQWDDSRGVLTEAEWRDWLFEARADDRFDEAELNAIGRELGVVNGATDDGGLFARVRRLLG